MKFIAILFEFQLDDTLIILHDFENGWYVGQNIETKAKGLVKSEFVTLHEQMPSKYDSKNRVYSKPECAKTDALYENEYDESNQESTNDNVSYFAPELIRQDCYE